MDSPTLHAKCCTNSADVATLGIGSKLPTSQGHGTVGLLLRRNDSTNLLVSTAAHNGDPKPECELTKVADICNDELGSDMALYSIANPAIWSRLNSLSDITFTDESGVKRKPKQAVSGIHEHITDDYVYDNLDSTRAESKDEFLFTVGSITQSYVSVYMANIREVSRSRIQINGVRLEGTGMLLKCDIESIQGDSGACLLLEKSGKVHAIGVLTGGGRHSDGSSFAYFTQFSDLTNLNEICVAGEQVV